MSRSRVLNLVTNPDVNTFADFDELGEWIRELDPALYVFVFPDVAAADVAAGVPDLPALTVSPAPLRHLRPRRGAVFQGQHVAKSVEYRALSAVGINVPRWQRLLPGERPDLRALGEYVVTKPDFGARGAEVRIERSTTAVWTPPRTDLGARFGGQFNPRLAQQFVYTGAWPRSHRVATLFGQALWTLRVEASHGRAPLASASEFRGQSVVSSGAGCTFELHADADVIALAERAHAALPHVPLLGVDILRAADSGELFVIELNSLGYTWHFSSPSGIELQRQFGFDLSDQFDGRRKAARVLADACTQYAR